MKNTLLLFFLSFFLTLGVQAQSSFDLGNATAQLNQNGKKTVLKIYPNPATNYIGLNNDTKVSEIKILNLVGKEVKHFYVSKGEKYPVMDIRNGMYLVQLINDSGKIMTTQRLQKR